MYEVLHSQERTVTGELYSALHALEWFTILLSFLNERTSGAFCRQTGSEPFFPEGGRGSA